MLGVTYPIVQGGMMWVGTAQLAAAVSNGGGFGIITALTQPTPDALWEEIGKCRNLTNRPFAVNLRSLPASTPPPYEPYLDICVRAQVRAIATAGKVPPEFIARARAGGLKVSHKCVSLRHALSAQKHGADAISIDGFECAGHPGDDDIGGMV